MATVDVIVRTKDRPLFLERALGSITGQLFDDWRVVLVNDGGDPAVLRDVLGRFDLDGRLEVIDHEQSLGRWPSANAGVDAASAPFLVLHDDDDTWHPEFLRDAVAHLQAHDDQVGVVSRIEIVWESFDGSVFTEDGREPFQPQLTAPMLADLMLFNRFVPIGFLYRRELHEVLGPYREDLAVVGDWEFNLRVLSRWPLEYLGDEPLAYWHQRPTSTGVDGNSVVAEERKHLHYDRLIRDARLREHVQREGAGDLLYLTKFVDQRFWDIEHHLDGEVRGLAERLERHVEERLRAVEERLDHATSRQLEAIEDVRHRVVWVAERGSFWAELKARTRRVRGRRS